MIACDRGQDVGKPPPGKAAIPSPPSGPEETARRYLQALRSKDPKEATACLSDSVVKEACSELRSGLSRSGVPEDQWTGYLKTVGFGLTSAQIRDLPERELCEQILRWGFGAMRPSPPADALPSAPGGTPADPNRAVVTVQDEAGGKDVVVCVLQSASWRVQEKTQVPWYGGGIARRMLERRTFERAEIEKCRVRLAVLNNEATVYLSEFFNKYKKFPPDAVGPPYWLRSAREALNLSDPEQMKPYVCPLSGRLYRGPAPRAEKARAAQLMGCCEPGGHPDGSISVITEQGEARSVGPSDPLYDRALQSTLGQTPGGAVVKVPEGWELPIEREGGIERKLVVGSMFYATRRAGFYGEGSLLSVDLKEHRKLGELDWDLKSGSLLGATGTKVFLSFHERLRCYERSLARMLWEIPWTRPETMAAVDAAWVVLDERLGLWKGGGKVRAVGLEDGKEAWSLPGWEYLGATADGVLFTPEMKKDGSGRQSLGDTLICVDRGGKERWRQRLYDRSSGALPVLRIASITPHGVVLTQSPNLSWRLLDPATGETVWSKGSLPLPAGRPKQEDWESSFLFELEGCIVWASGAALGAADLKTGKDLWAFGGLPGSVEGVSWTGEVLLIQSPPRVYAFEVRTGKKLWEADDVPGGGFDLGSKHYVQCSRKYRLSILDPRTGSVLYEPPDAVWTTGERLLYLDNFRIVLTEGGIVGRRIVIEK